MNESTKDRRSGVELGQLLTLVCVVCQPRLSQRRACSSEAEPWCTRSDEPRTRDLAREIARALGEERDHLRCS
jgi:hypothetical protein